MNPVVERLLKLTPGVICSKNGVVREMVDFPDWTRLLTMRSPIDHEFSIGDWVRIRRGRYANDVGLVTTIESWGVQLLLVPRLPSSPGTSTFSKRKRTTLRPEPALFDPIAFKRGYNTSPVERAPGMYEFKGLSFHHGLIVKAFDFHSISPVSVCIYTDTISLFQQSGHHMVS
jgi:hypothetical protein